MIAAPRIFASDLSWISMPKVGLWEWQQLLKSKSSELTVANREDEEES
jgi:hypothetical protein